MTYGDEEIISQRIALQSAKSHTISNKVNIDGKLYSFARREFLSCFSMVVPESFDTLAPEYAKRKYPYEDRPSIIISNEATDTDFAFDFGAMPDLGIRERISQYRAIIKRVHPSYVFFSDHIYTTSEEINIACYDFRSLAIDKDIYNLSFFTDLPDNEMFGWFTCPIDQQNKWEPLVRQMIQTIKPLPQDEE